MVYQFDDILREVGSFGKFQKKLVFLFLTPICFTLPFFLLNTIFLLAVPEHHCIAPGRENFNFTLQEWKNLTVPREKGMYKRCSHYDTSSFNGNSSEEEFVSQVNSKEIIECDKNWQYDDGDFGTSVVVHYNWVCKEEANVPFGFFLMILGNSLGALVLSPLADIIGRRIVFFVTATIYLVFSLMMTFPFSPKWFFVFLFLKSLAFPVEFMVAYVHALEFVGPEHRSFVNALTNIVWSLGMVGVTVVAYLCRDHWQTLSLVCSLLGAFLFLYLRFLTESPRWLISKRRFEEANKILMRVMKTNGKFSEGVTIIEKISHIQEDKPEPIKNMLRIFLKRKQVFRIVLVTLIWSAVLTLYYGCHFNLENMAGNIYWNNIALSAIEIPAYLTTGVLLEKLGRRWIGFSLVLISGISYALVAAVPTDSTWIILTLCVIAKFGVSGSFMTVYLHAPEIFPTMVRACALGLPACVSNLMNMAVPYVVFLGHTTGTPSIPFLILGGMSVAAAPLVLFLPETLNQKLPQSLIEAEVFGASQKFWSFNKGGKERKRSLVVVAEQTQLYTYKPNDAI